MSISMRFIFYYMHWALHSNHTNLLCFKVIINPLYYFVKWELDLLLSFIKLQNHRESDLYFYLQDPVG